MTRTSLRNASACSILLALGGCGLLDVSDPTAIEEKDVVTATGANLLRHDAVGQFYETMPEQVHWSGMLADELRAYAMDNSFDRREVVTEQRLAILTRGFQDLSGSTKGPYVRWQETRTAASVAIHADGGERLVEAYRGELFALRGYATLYLAETFCPGFPLHDVVDFTPIHSPPISTQEGFERALSDLDSAVVYAADSARILNFAKVGRARALLGLGRIADAAAASASVPTGYVWNAEFSSTDFALSNGLARWSFIFRRSVADREGNNGLNFITAADLRVQTRVDFVSPTFGPRIVPMKYLDNKAAPIVVASGVEARLIDAEAALQAGNPIGWLGQLNALRTDGTQTDGEWNPGSGGVGGLAPLVDPGTDATRVDLLFRERAFWLFLTGRRLADLRRLVSFYGRQAETVFPTGPYPLGGQYGTATSIVFPTELETPHNPAVTGCTSY